ncbi:MAG: putative glycosyltransferase [Verrucomicrobiaceae bacterium]|nr:putative glycosyltransferase [Verrucomicrobiaceae bacterium]
MTKRCVIIAFVSNWRLNRGGIIDIWQCQAIAHRKNTELNSEYVGGGSAAIVIVNYYSAHLLRRTLQCVRDQKVQPQQVIVVNNGDEPGALDFLPQDYPGCILFEQKNLGFAAANNLAMGQSQKCRWVVLLNPDAFPNPDWLQNLIHSASLNPSVDVFSSHLVMAGNTQLIDGDGDQYHFSGLAWRLNHGRPIEERRSTGTAFSPCAAAAMYSREALAAVGGFDESFFCYFEDVDLGFRLRLKGYQCLHVSDAVASHVGGSSSSSPELSDFALYYGHRNLVWTFVKNMPGYLFWLFLPVHLTMNIVTIFWFAFRGKGRVIVRAKIDALKRLPEVWAQRQQIQATRKISPTELLKVLSFWPRR